MNKVFWSANQKAFTKKEIADLAKAWGVIIAIVAMSTLGFSTLASAQTAETVKAAAKVADIQAKADVEAAEIAAKAKRDVARIQAAAQVEAAKAAAKAAKKAPKPTASDDIGIAAENKAVTTVTYRDARGVAYEGSRDWAKHEEKMAEIAQGPKDPCSGKMAWFTCPIIPVAVVPTYGYSDGGGVRIVQQPRFVHSGGRPVVTGGAAITGCGEGGCNIVYSSGGVATPPPAPRRRQ